MKKCCIALLMLFFYLSCSNDEEILPDNNQNLDLDTHVEDGIKEYNVKKEGLTVEWWIYSSNDTTKAFFNGRIDNKLWIGIYDRNTKNQLWEFQENTPLDTLLNLHVGYGEYKEFEIDFFQIYYPCINNDTCCFLLIGENKKYNATTGFINSYLYFVTANTLVKKYKSYFYPEQFSKYFASITPWYEGVMVEKFPQIDNEKYICYNMQGDSLFTINTIFRIDENYNAINYEEYIQFNIKSSSINKSVFIKSNIRKGEVVWANNVPPLQDFPDNTRIENTFIEKNSDVWIYTLNYILFNGEKGEIKIELDIHTGEYNIK